MMDTKTLEKKGEKAVEKIKESWKSVAENELPKVQDTYAKTLDKAEKEFRQVVDDYGSKLQDTSEKLRDNTNTAVTTTRDFVQQYPWQSGAIAMVVLGILLGFLLKGRQQTNSV
jgi:ElaB/YqjD/DUF883 family membrane-anchored ribosome-binding protein